MQPLTNRRIKFVMLAFESSGWTDPTVQKLVNVWEQQASRRLGPALVAKHEPSSEIQSILELGFPHPAVGRGTLGV